VCTALARTSWDVEIIVVDDGSTDATLPTLEGLAPTLPYPMKVVSQANKGRFLARWEGVKAASHDNLLILDSRLIVHEDAFAYLDAHVAESAGQPWNGHVVTDPASPLVGQFWLVPTHVFWSEYLARPRRMEITAENFDRLPKGTGFLFVRKEQFVRACEFAWPEMNAHLTSDDTKLLRFIVSETNIRLDPGFAATYFPRASVASFLKHGFERGTLFVDSYAGTSALRNVILFLLPALPVAFLVALLVLLATGNLVAARGAVVIAIAVACLPAALAAIRNCPPRAVLSYFAFVVPFGIVFVSGVIRGLFVHRRSFAAASPSTKVPE
jgi:glycosyltransferase involved in cell wall biosynthesis